MMFLSACTQSTWTEEFDYYGFKDGFKNSVVYKKGAYTKLVINVSSGIYKELTYPLTLNVHVNETICASETLDKPKQQQLLSATCEENLGPGKHTFKALLASPDNFNNVSIEKDREYNHYHGSITYTLEK